MGNTTNHKTITLYDFTSNNKFQEKDFNYITGTDGKLEETKEGLKISSVPFTSTVPSGQEHPKYVRFSSQRFHLSNSLELLFESSISGHQVLDPITIPEKMRPRIRNVDEDLRLASSGLTVYDPETAIVFAVLLTNTAIYAVYEKEAIIRDDTSTGFSSAVWIGQRSLNQFTKVTIGLDKKSSRAVWYINDAVVFTLNGFGLLPNEEYLACNYGGQPTLVNITTVRVGFGTFTILDNALPNNYSRSHVRPELDLNGQISRDIATSQLVQLHPTHIYKELYPDPLTGQNRSLQDTEITFAYPENSMPNHNHDIKLFGQGAVLLIRYIKVYSRNN